MAWLLKRPIRWILMALAIPVAIWAADSVAERIEGGRGPSTVTRTLRAPGRWRRGESLLAD
jgi:hypothetical protein